jgi:periplasmic mercuric ion binding protein
MKSLSTLLATLTLAVGAHAAAGHSATLAVSNMDCATCPITVRKALEKVPGVEAAKIDFKTKLAVVSFDPAKTKPEALVKATADAGYPSTLKQVQ